jgi:asparagine synthase (glutamine-hydrolysing)
MCGIVGFVSHGPSDSRGILDRALASIAHRGPDGNGQFSDNRVHLGHCRLSIIDLRDVANQPMVSDDGSLIIVFNGEIYNYVELRDALMREGAVFRTRSDTEVILRYYEYYKEDCVVSFNGMWSFIIYDTVRRVLFGSRDRFGEKPFFFHISDGEFYFSSEIKALIAMGVDTKIELQYLKEFCYWDRYEPAVGTNFKGVDQLPAAHSLLFDIEKKTTKIWKYYRLEQQLSDLSGVVVEDACAEFESRLRDAVRIRNRADVPIGVALSGGIDSSLIAAELADLIRDNHFRSAVTVNVDAGTQELSEAAAARDTAQKLNLAFVQVSAHMDDLLETVLKVHWHQETPASTMSTIMSWNTYRQFRNEGIPVALDGQGGDEILLGYSRYVAIPVFELLSAGNFLSAAKLLWRIAGHNDDLTLPRSLALCSWGWFNSFKQLNRLVRKTIQLDARTVFLQPKNAHCPLRRRVSSQVDEIERWTLPGLLKTADRNSMAHGIEVRLPYLDPNVVEYAVSIPSAMKFEGGFTKAPSRRLLSAHGLHEIATARRKLSFQGPEQDWLRQLGSVPFDYASRSPVVEELVGRKMTKERFLALPVREQWKFFSVAIIGSQYGVA